ncbi:MAG: hypothetical protein ABSC95_30090 [Acetobacteraceae bacterium]
MALPVAFRPGPLDLNQGADRHGVAALRILMERARMAGTIANTRGDTLTVNPTALASTLGRAGAGAVNAVASEAGAAISASDARATGVIGDFDNPTKWTDGAVRQCGVSPLGASTFEAGPDPAAGYRLSAAGSCDLVT